MKDYVGSLVHHDNKTMVKVISLEDNFGALRDPSRGLNFKENENDSNAFNSTPNYSTNWNQADCMAI